MVEAAAHPHLGLILDSFHTLAIDDDIGPIAALPGDRIFMVQLADAPRLSTDILSWSRHFRCFPGQGDFDVSRFLAAVIAAGYAGPLSLEIFNDDFRAAPTRQTAADGMRSLLFVEERARAVLEARAAAAAGPAKAPARKRRVELFDPPPAPVLLGTSFVEFAVDSNSERKLGEMLDAIGFARAGRHRSKDVTFYRQGGINLIVNAEKDSFAHSYFLMHGPSICAVALSADDEIRALSRAEAFGARRFEARVGPTSCGSRRSAHPTGGSSTSSPMAASRRMGSTRTSSWSPPLRRGTPVSCGSTISPRRCPKDSQFVALFFRSALGLEAEGALELADPYGLVHSRAMASANRALRFPLNLSQSRNTATARSVLLALAGAGVHHIALESRRYPRDRHAAARCGGSLLPIPPNYYDDLAARPGSAGRLRPEPAEQWPPL